MISTKSVNFQKKYELPEGTSILESQVAGHPFDVEKNTISMLKSDNGHVLKPVSKILLGKREIEFYENLQNASDDISSQLLRFIPNYYGTRELEITEKSTTFLELADITKGMSEPCVMDIKIGKRTWDPLAGEEKQIAEGKKYVESRRAYGFCIPGFQVYRLSDGQLRKFGKDYGKQLNEKSVIEALELFLNISTGNLPNRDLILKLLSFLWKILAFFRAQKKYRFYSSSLLIAYDAMKLRQLTRLNGHQNESSLPSMNRSNTFSHSLNSVDIQSQPVVIENGIKGLFKSASPTFLKRAIHNRTLDRFQTLKRSLSSHEITKKEIDKQQTTATSTPIVNFEENRLFRTHSYTHNFDNDIKEMKEDYATILAELCGKSKEQQNWVRINMIDFTHVFPADDDDFDHNYLEGLESLIKLLERFLARVIKRN
ncbi:inositol polyphosphate multikinase [Leptopilina heterotoma]|uniref:inositol polyphosphate multikinase n=1 Tax=Leptopilina heterotoma TaxID=63436 RepID=UPI001CA8779A|nr:inositol polyphosphate multikinase [Leptopilina heterotoma]